VSRLRIICNSTSRALGYPDEAGRQILLLCLVDSLQRLRHFVLQNLLELGLPAIAIDELTGWLKDLVFPWFCRLLFNDADSAR
jgi:hypothetical protein